MSKIEYKKIADAVKKLCIKINYVLPGDVSAALKKARKREKNLLARNTLFQIMENLRIAEKNESPLCQDTGAVEVFARLGRSVKIIGGRLEDAVNEGVSAAYLNEKFRKSIVRDPFKRENTKDNTPASVYVETSEGDNIKLKVLLKGAGSENSSSINFFTPNVSWDSLEGYILENVYQKALYSCPPVVVSVAVGGNFSSAPAAAKKALFRNIGAKNPDKFYDLKEKRLLHLINLTGIGPMGTGGKTTALAVYITALPVHIASLPCAISIQCHSLRRGEVTI